MVAAASSIQEQEESLDRLEQKLAEFEAQQSLMKNVWKSAKPSACAFWPLYRL